MVAGASGPYPPRGPYGAPPPAPPGPLGTPRPGPVGPAVPQWGPPAQPMYHYTAPRPRRGGGGGLLWLTLALGFATLVVGGAAVLLQVVAAAGSAASARTGIEAHSPRAPVAAPYGRGHSGSRGAVPAGSVAGTSTGARVATASRLYQVGAVTGLGCVGRRIRPRDSASFRGFLGTTADCLDRSWAAAFNRAGLPFSPPQRVFWTTPGRSPCGDYPAPGVAAFYCSLNNAIYIGAGGHAQKSAGNLPVTYNVAYARNLAHEYAHHVQETSGILPYSRELRMRETSVDERNAVTRRSELQAQCFAGVFMAAVRPTFPVSPEQWRMALRDAYGRGDDPSAPEARDHGTGAHYAGWLNLGYTSGSTAVCNTWTAPAAKVS
ncbi:MAG: putative protein of unknown function zinc metallopeptidase [Streptosporangiaceae bacterium]|nr:putative protein of unknown function zinc metallopeptidase [Streptosporangiaceae bacterium]